MTESVQVAIRWRPLLKREDKALDDWLVYPQSVVLKQEYGEKEWTFDKVFDESQNSAEVYDALVRPIVSQAIKGYNGTVFAYGQTGSGKTFTMRGNSELPGIIPRTVEHLLTTFESMTEREFMIGMIYIEIYNEKIKNLLSSEERKLTVKEDVETGNFEIQGVEQRIVNSAEDILKLLEEGDRRRAVAATNMNEHSSRSHAIFRLTVESREKALGSRSAITKSQLNLVDLAGSEKAAQTGASGQTLKEGASINKSLFMLGRVISELTSSAEHISYRDSVLTRILQPALGGNAKTAIIATATRANVAETKSTMQFANGAKMIKNKVRVNESVTKDALIHRQAEEIKKLKQQLSDTDANENVNDLQQRIVALQKLVINFRAEEQPTKAPKQLNRRHTVHHTTAPGVSRKPTIERLESFEEEWIMDAADALDRIDGDRELRMIESQNEKKRKVSESAETPIVKRHKSMFNPGTELLLELDFADLTPEKFDQLKKSLRKSELPAIPEPDCKDDLKAEVAELRQKLSAAEISAKQEYDEILAAAETIAKEKYDEKLAAAETSAKEKYEEKIARLDAKMAILGDNKTVEELINQTVSIHAELKDKNQTIRRLEEAKVNFNESTLQEFDQMKETILLLQGELQKSVHEKTLLVKSTAETATNTEELIDTGIIDSAVIEEALQDKKNLEARLAELKAEMSFVSDERHCHDEEVESLNNQLKESKELAETQNQELQQSKAELEKTHNALAEAVRDLEKAGLVDVDSMTEMLMKAQKEESMAKLRLEMAEEKAAEAEAALEPSKLEIVDLKAKLEKVQEQLQTSNERDAKTIADLQHELSVAMNGHGRLEHSIQQQSVKDAETQAVVDCAEQGVTVDFTTEELEDVSSKLAETKSKFDEYTERAESEIKTKDAEVARVQEKVRQLEEEMAKLRDHHENQQRQVESSQKELDGEKQAALTKVEELISQVERVNIEKAEVTSALEEKKSSLTELESKLEASSTSLAETKEELSALKTALESAEQDKATFESDVAKMKSEHEENKVELEKMRGLNEDRLKQLALNLTKIEHEKTELEKDKAKLEQVVAELIATAEQKKSVELIDAEMNTSFDQMELSVHENVTAEKKTIESAPTTSQMSKEEMEALGIEEDSATIDPESQVNTQMNIIESVECCVCPGIVRNDVAIQCEPVSSVAAGVNTSFCQMMDQNVSAINFDSSVAEFATDAPSFSKDMVDAKSVVDQNMSAINFNASVTEFGTEVPSFVAPTTTDAGTLTDPIQDEKSEVSEQVKPVESKNVSLNTSVFVDLERKELETALEDEQNKTNRLVDEKKSLQLVNQQLAVQLQNEQRAKMASDGELVKCQAELASCKENFEAEMAKVASEIEADKIRLEPLREELAAVRSQRSDYAEKYKEACAINADKDAKLHAAAEMYQGHKAKIQQLEQQLSAAAENDDLLRQSHVKLEQLQVALSAESNCLNEARSTIDKLTDETNKIKAENENLHARCNVIKELNNDIEQVTRSLELKEAEVTNKESLLMATTKELQEVKQEMESIKGDCAQLAAACNDMSKENLTGKEMLKKAKSELVEKEDALLEKKNKIAQLQSDILTLQTKQQNTPKESVTALKAKISELEEARLSLISRNNTNEEHLVNIKNEMKRMLEAVDQYESNEMRLKTELNEIKIAKNNSDDEVVSLKHQGSVFKKEYLSMQAQLSESVGKVKEKDSAVQTLQEKVNQLEQEAKTINKDKTDVANALSEKEAKYKRLADAYVEMKREAKRLQAANVDISEVKEKLKKYYNLYHEIIEKPCGSCGRVPVSGDSAASSTSSSMTRSRSASSASRPRATSGATTSKEPSAPLQPQSPKPNTAEEKPECKQQ